MRFWWLRCRASQDQFFYYWDAGSKNWANYHTKHHPDNYHEAHCSSHAGYWAVVTQAHSFSCTTIGSRVSPCGFSLFLFAVFYFLTEYYFPHIVNDAARVCRSQDSWEQTDRPQI
jgi:hypothetical protein